jgi:hypothetical protein
MSDWGWPPGWYPDPGTSGRARWWDGAAWTEFVTLGPGPPTAPKELVARQHQMLGWAQGAVILYVATATVSVELGRAAAIRRYFRWYHQVFAHLGTPGYVQAPAPTILPRWSALLAIPGIFAVVTFLIWQYRAASAARALGLPAARSPGWGVGCWFVPVVNLWMPMQALRDCLPPGHARRRLAWKLLAAWAVTGGLSSAAAPVFAYAETVGLALFALDVVAQVTVLTLALRLVRTIGAAQQQLAALI